MENKYTVEIKFNYGVNKGFDPLLSLIATSFGRNHTIYKHRVLKNGTLSFGRKAVLHWFANNDHHDIAEEVDSYDMAILIAIVMNDIKSIKLIKRD